MNKMKNMTTEAFKVKALEWAKLQEREGNLIRDIAAKKESLSRATKKMNEIKNDLVNNIPEGTRCVRVVLTKDETGNKRMVVLVDLNGEVSEDKAVII